MAPPQRLARPVPAVRFRPPERQPAAVLRARVQDALNTAAAGRHLSVVSAPSGYGKTTAVAEWATSRPFRSWLALSASDADPSSLAQGVIDALHTGAERSGLPLTLPRTAPDPARAYAAICDWLDGFDQPVSLIVDDAQRAGEHWRRGGLG
ncbi:hypothetical protein ACNPNP_00250, partial [Microbacterium sp. AGC85]